MGAGECEWWRPWVEHVEFFESSWEWMPFSMLCVYVCGFKQHIFMIVIYVYEIASQHSIRKKWQRGRGVWVAALLRRVLRRGVGTEGLSL